MKFKTGIIALMVSRRQHWRWPNSYHRHRRMFGPEQVRVMRLSDQANHFFVMSQGKCHWTKPIDIAGTKTQSDEATVTKEVHGNEAHVNGYVTETTASGDKFSYHIQGEQAIDHGKTVSEHGRWTIVSGTGKLKGLRGKGAYNGKLHGKSMVFDLKGECEAAR